MPNKGGGKGTRWMDPSQGKKKKRPTRVDCKGNMNKSSTQTFSCNKGEEKVQDGWTQVKAKRRNDQLGWTARGT